MKLVLIIIIIGFIVWFIGGIISAAIFGRKKNRRAYAVLILAQLPEEIRKKLINIWLAYKNNNVEEVNNIVATIGSIQLSQLLGLIGPQNRPREFSAGKFGDNLSWTTCEITGQELGYTINASKILAGIIFHYLDIVLMEMEINRKNKKLI